MTPATAPAGDLRQARTLELVAAFYAAYNRGDSHAMLAMLAADVVHDRNQGPLEVGIAAFAAFLQRMALHYREEFHGMVVMASADGRHAAAQYQVEGEYRVDDDGMPPARGQRYSLSGGAFFRVHDGLVRRISNYYNLRELIAQVDAGGGKPALPRPLGLPASGA